MVLHISDHLLLLYRGDDHILNWAWSPSNSNKRCHLYVPPMAHVRDDLRAISSALTQQGAFSTPKGPIAITVGLHQGPGVNCTVWSWQCLASRFTAQSHLGCQWLPLFKVLIPSGFIWQSGRESGWEVNMVLKFSQAGVDPGIHSQLHCGREQDSWDIPCSGDAERQILMPSKPDNTLLDFTVVRISPSYPYNHCHKLFYKPELLWSK